MSYTTVLIDKDIVDSLRGLYFNDLSDPFRAAAHRAYRDFNRTLRLKKTLTDAQSEDLCDQAIEILRRAFHSLHASTVKDQDSYDRWHRKSANEIIGLYNAVHITMYYGQAQKWINMTAKYVYLIGLNDFDDIFRFLHVPIDNYVLDLGFSFFDIGKPNKAWSQWTESEYYHYQRLLRSSIEDDCPLRWEFRNWLASARSFPKDA